MDGSKSMVEQAHELTIIYYEFGQQGMGINECLQVTCTIDKLPSS